jgi:hypothetical protein
MKEVLIKKEVQNYTQRSRYRWPIQEQPHITTFHIWRNTLQEAFGVSMSGKLRQKLGDWTKAPLDTINFQYIIDPTKTRLLSKQNNDNWCEHAYKKYSRGRIHYESIGRLISEPEDIRKYIPVDCL